MHVGRSSSDTLAAAVAPGVADKGNAVLPLGHDVTKNEYHWPINDPGETRFSAHPIRDTILRNDHCKQSDEG